VAKKVLVTLGGADPDNVTLKVIQSLQIVEVEELEAVVVVGGSNPHYENLKMAVQGSRYPIQLQRNVTNMPELMAWADVAISAGGSTCWELAFMGLPSIVLILAENQRLAVEKLDVMEVAFNLGYYQDICHNNIHKKLSTLIFNSNLRLKNSQNGYHLIDGSGNMHIAKLMKSFKKA
jgi:spore coat polysaccharide biosynthesis predicted glycosyltransferase SpsG